MNFLWRFDSLPRYNLFMENIAFGAHFARILPFCDSLSVNGSGNSSSGYRALARHILPLADV